MINYYEVLEVSEKASDEVIEKAYKVLAKKYHPDLQQGANKKIAEEKMKIINEAYDVLSNKGKREDFDRKLSNEKVKEVIKQQTQANINNSYNRYNNSNVSHNYYRANNISSNNINQQAYNNEELKRQQKYKESLEEEARRRYLQAYDNYLRSLGYRVKYKWTWKRVKDLSIAILIIIIIGVILWIIPFSRELLIKLYNENFAIKLIVDLIGSIIQSIISLFKK